jgi:hypothetical protein
MNNSPLKSQVQKIYNAVEPIQIRGQKNDAIIVVSPMDGFLKIYNEKLNYEEYQYVFNAIAQSANAALTALKGAFAVYTTIKEGLKDSAKANDFESNVLNKPMQGNVLGVKVSIDRTEKFLSIEGTTLEADFLNDLIVAMNATYAKARLMVGEELQKL